MIDWEICIPLIYWDSKIYNVPKTMKTVVYAQEKENAMNFSCTFIRNYSVFLTQPRLI